MRYGDMAMITLPFVSLDPLAYGEQYGMWMIADAAFTRWHETVKEVAAQENGLPAPFGAYISTVDAALRSATPEQLARLKLSPTDLARVEADAPCEIPAAGGCPRA